MMRTIRVLIGAFAFIALSLGIALALTAPEPLAENSESAARLAPGPFEVELTELTWVDSTRPTSENGDYPGAPERRLSVALWSPIDAPGPHPLLVYSHGFMSTRHGGRYMADHLASHGYVVVSTDYPLTNYQAPGGPNADDVVAQPGDVRFMIDQALAMKPSERPFVGEIDTERIGAFGVSLGGLTTTLAGFHPTLGDPRIRVAISIAGPAVMFGPTYFEQADVPFLMIASTHDAMIDYSENASVIPERIRKGGLITLAGGSHAGFSHLTSGPLRLLGNPDGIGCGSLMDNLDVEDGKDPFPNLGGEEIGILDAAGARMPCEQTFDEAMTAGRQQMLTTLAAHAFFESQFATRAEERAAHAEFLATTFPREIEEVSFTPARL